MILMNTPFNILGNDATMQNTLVCLGAFVLALIIEFRIIPQVLLISREKQLFDTPDSRKSHTHPIPRLGGFTFLPVIMLTFLPILAIQMQWLDASTMTYSAVSMSNHIFLMSGGVVLMLIGIKDDLIGSKASRKFIIQIIAASFLIFSGNYINTLHGLFGIYEIPAYVGMPLTVFFVVYVINSFNLIDGVDGLAGTLGCIAAFGFGILLLLEQDCPYSILAFAILGVLISFLRYNFSNKRKIFMGDTGSLTIGYLLAFLAVHFSMSTAHTSAESVAQPIVLAWSVMFVPLFDTFRVICVRAWHRKPLFSPDRNHIHHKLLDLGYTHKETTIILAVCALVILLFNVIMQQNAMNINLILTLNCAMSFLFSIDLGRQKKRAEVKEESRATEVSEQMNT